MARYLNTREVVAILPVSRAGFYRHLRHDPTFPQPIRIGARSFWSEADVREWAK